MEKLWTTSEVATYLGIAETDVEQLVRDGRLTGYKLGGQFLRFRPDQVKGVKSTMAPKASATVAAAPRVPVLERVQDFIYFYDFYLVSLALLIGVVIYLVSAS